MVKSWFMDDLPTDQKSPHQLSPGEYITEEELAEIGIEHWFIEDPIEENPVLARLRSERGYSYSDVVEVSREKLPNYDAKVKQFYDEHLHADEEIRLVLSGSGYFDVRSKDDRWVRIAVHKGDLLVLPAGIYHRFTVDTGDYIKAMRLFTGEPVWTPINRPQGDAHKARADYVARVEGRSSS